MNDTNIVAESTNSGLKHLIIGKLWTASADGSHAGSIRISRTLPANITLKPDSTLFLNTNKKREGKNDPDFTVSILLPTVTADRLIEAEKKLIEAEKAAAVQAEVEPR